ncbi:MAG: NAD-dependent deacetylase [Sulfurimonas sp.]
MAKIVILSGAGISAESGISTFRDNNGLWEEYDVQVVCNYDSLEKNEDITIEFYDKRRAELEDKEPNHAHEVITQLKKRHPNDIAVITQNVDNLFEKSGLAHEDIIHLHGFMPEVCCQNPNCSFLTDIGYKKQKEVFHGLCPNCSTHLRPNIVFFGEAAPKYEELQVELDDCELFIVIGTSGYVINTDRIVVNIENSILNNLEKSDAIFDELYTKVLYKPATQAIDEIAQDIELFFML